MPEREWDMRVVWLVDRRCWWWNAWHARTGTELFGRAETSVDARNALSAAISDWHSAAGPDADGRERRSGGPE